MPHWIQKSPKYNFTIYVKNNAIVSIIYYGNMLYAIQEINLHSDKAQNLTLEELINDLIENQHTYCEWLENNSFPPSVSLQEAGNLIRWLYGAKKVYVSYYESYHEEVK